MVGHEIKRDHVIDGLSVRVLRDAHAADPVDRLNEPSAVLDPVGVLLVELGELVDQQDRVQDADAVGEVERVGVGAEVEGNPSSSARPACSVPPACWQLITAFQ